jgi:monoterpene epsilon-lactone hydrolase
MTGKSGQVSAELADMMRLGAADAKTMGVADGVLDLAGYRSVVRPSQFELPMGTAIIDANANGVPCKWISTRNADPSVRLLYLHGGGYVAGGWESHRGIAAWIAEAVGCVVLLPEYRLAPEHPFPAGLNDAAAAFAWMAETELGGPKPARATLIAGDSAGAGLAVATMLELRERGHALPDACVAISPFFNLDAATSPTIPTSGFWQGIVDAYVGKTNDPTDPKISPIFADLVGLPPMLIQVGDADVLLADSTEFVTRASMQSAAVKISVWSKMPHVWHKFVPQVPEAREAIEEIGNYLRDVIGNK